MRIEKLKEEHLIEISKLALENYQEERLAVKDLPEIDEIPELEIFAKDELGVVAFEGNDLVGYLGVYPAFEGAYCVPEYRGRHVYDDLLEFVIETMMKEGYTLLGVDCESYNPNALHYWNKHFTEYTSSVTRRTENWASK